MAISWTAKLKEINGISQIHWSVKDDSKLIGIYGCWELEDDETTTEPLVDCLKTKMGSVRCTTHEEEAKVIDDTPPTPL